MKRKLLQIISFIALIAFCSCSQQVHYATLDLPVGEDATPALMDLLTLCREQKIQKLVIPKNEYHCYPDQAGQRYVHATNNDDGLKRIVFDLKDFHDFEIDAQGSLFVMHGQISPIDVDGASNIVLRNFAIDWNKPFYLQGEVVEVSEKDNSFDLKILDECDYEIVANDLIFLEKPGCARKPWKEWAMRVQEKTGWEQTMDWNIWYDTKTKIPAYKGAFSHIRTWNEQKGVRYRAEELEPGLVRLYDAVNKMPQVGWSVVVKGIKSLNRFSPAIHFNNSKNVLIEDVQVHHAGGMGLISERCDGVTLRRFQVKLPENSERLVTTTADATHFVGCRGKILIEDCFFENMLDDATNVHGVYTRIEKMVDDHTIGVNLIHGQQLGFIFAQKGDTLRLSEKTTMKPYATLRVDDVRVVNNEYLEIRFTEEVANILRPHSVADNISWQAYLHFTESTVRRNRARTILISTEGDVLIDKNNFETCTSVSLLFEGDATFWHESGPVKNVRICDNTFSAFGLEVGRAPLIRFSPRVGFTKDNTQDYYYHKNITIENNQCNVICAEILQALSVENLVFKGNVIKQHKGYPFTGNLKRAISLSHCNNVLIEGNTYDLDGKKLGVYQTDCKNINVRDL